MVRDGGIGEESKVVSAVLGSVSVSILEGDLDLWRLPDRLVIVDSWGYQGALKGQNSHELVPFVVVLRKIVLLLFLLLLLGFSSGDVYVVLVLVEFGCLGLVLVVFFFLVVLFLFLILILLLLLLVLLLLQLLRRLLLLVGSFNFPK